MNELVVISGKGGTGKTSVTASFAVAAGSGRNAGKSPPVIVDCDVDAADLHLVLSSRLIERHEFRSGHVARIRKELCTGCGVCYQYCRFGAVGRNNHHKNQKEAHVNAKGSAKGNIEGITKCNKKGCRDKTGYFVDPVACEGCGVCVRFCPSGAIEFQERICGHWMVSQTGQGLLVHARLGVAADNSGKLVTTVRRKARGIAEETESSLIIVDGPPGTGCPVIASITGASMVLAVTEPSLSGEHDLKRVLSLARHFQVPAGVCVNKWDINPQITKRIEEYARSAGARVAGRVRYDEGVTRAQMQGLSVVETDAPSARDILHIWNNVSSCLE